jgi:ADP-heptose:LPS heptosyltransferase
MEPGNEVPIEQIRSVAGETDKNREYTRDDVIDSFRRLSDGLKDTVKDRLTDGMLPQDAPDQETWGYLITESARQRANAEGEAGTYTNEFPKPDGSTYQQTEGIPVEHLLAYATKQLESEDLSPEEKQKIAQDALTLWNTSKSYLDYPQRRYDLSKIIARTKQEAYLIDRDYRSTGSQDENWFGAENSLIGTSLNTIQDTNERNRLKRRQRNHSLLFQRREMVVPIKKVNNSVAESTGTSNQEYIQSDFNNQIDTQTNPPINSDTLPNPNYRQTDFLDKIDNLIQQGATQDQLPINNGNEGVDAPNGQEQPQVTGDSDLPPTREEQDAEQQRDQEQPQDDGEGEQPQIEVDAPQEDPRFDLMIVNRLSDKEKAAREYAASKWNTMMNESSEVRSKLDRVNPLRWARRVKLRSLEEYYKQKMMQEYREATIQNNSALLTSDLAINSALRYKEQESSNAKISNLRTQVEMNDMRADTEVADITDDLKTRFNESVLRPLLSGDLPANIEERSAQIQTAIRQFVTDNKDNTSIQEFFGREATQFNLAADYFATDILQMVDKIKADQSTHQRVLENMDQFINLQFAKTEWRAQTGIDLNAADKTIAWLQGRKSTAFIANPAMVGLAFSLGTASLTKGRSLLAHTVGTPIAGALAGATFAALRRSKDLKVDFQTNAREKAYGEKNQDGSKRREALDTYLSTMASTDSLILGGKEGRNRTEEDYRGMNELLELDLSNETHRNALLSRSAEIQERLDFSVRQKVDLISYKTDRDVEQGRLELQLAVCKSIQKLKESGMSDDEVQAELRRFRGNWNQRFTFDRNVQDREFTNYRVRETVKAGASGALMGAIAGIAGEQVMGNLRRIPGTGVVGEKIGGLHDRFFNVESKGKSGNNQAILQEAYSTSEVKTFNVSESASVTIGPDHSVIVKDGDSIFEGTLSADGKITGTGELPDSAQDHLKSSFDIDIKEATATPAVTSEQLQQMAESGNGTFFLNEQTKVVYDAQKGFSLIDTDTNEPLFTSQYAKITPEGTIQVSGNMPEGLTTLLKDYSFDVKNIDIKDSQVEYQLFGPDTKMVDAAMGTGPDAPIIKVPEGTVWIDGKDGAHTLIMADRPDVVLIPDAKLENGEFTWDKNYSYPEYDVRIGERVDGLFSQVQISSETGQPTITTESIPVLGEGGEWERINTTIDTREWYSYDQPGSQGNELRLYTHKQGNGVVLDMSHMTTAHQQGLDPNPIDIPQIIQNKESGFYFSLPDHSKEGIWVPDGADGAWDGKLYLNPDDSDPSHIITTADGQTFQLGEFSKMVLSQNALSQLSDGNIATELYGNEEVFNLGTNTEKGFIEAARLIRQNDLDVLQEFATIRGESSVPEAITTTVTQPAENISTINIDTLTEKLPAIELTPQATETVEQFTLTPLENSSENWFTFPVTPFLQRYPLENLRRREYILSEISRRGGRIEDHIRIANPGEFTTPSPTRGERQSPTPTTATEQVRTTENIEGREALQVINERFREADTIYITLSSAVGDTVVTTAYIDGIRQYAEQQGGKNITILAPDNVHGLLKNYTDKHNITLLGGERHQLVDASRRLIEESDDGKAMVFDFDFTEYKGPNPILELNENYTVIHELFSDAVGLYTNERSGNNRFTEFLGNLLNIPSDQQLPAQPLLVLPSDSEQIYQQIVEVNTIDSSKQQVSIVIEGSDEYKRYDLNKWKEVINGLVDDQREFNIIFNPKENNYQRDELQNMFGAIQNARIISLDNWNEVMTFLQKQDLVLSNDTGLAHIATVVEDGPQVISLHSYDNRPDIWVSNPSRQLGIWNEDSSQTNSAIPPQTIIEKALERLNQTLPTAPIESPPVLNAADEEISLEPLEHSVTLSESFESGLTTENVDPTEVEELLEKLEFHGHPYNGTTLSVELIKEKGLIPKYRIQQNGVNIFLSSQAYSLGRGRAAVLAYVERDGKLIPRSYYRSNSQGVWRYLPAYKDGWFDKGYNEESVTLPLSIQEPLTKLISDHGVAVIENPKSIFFGTAKPLTEYKATVEDKATMSYYQEIQEKATRLSGNFYSSDRSIKIAPENLVFSDTNDSPDFSKKSSSWTGNNEMYGDVTYEVFPSRNGEYLYLFCKDSANRAWIGGVEKLSPTTSTGLSEEWVSGGNLTTPAFEYDEQAGGYGNYKLHKDAYVDMFENYLSKIPVIQEYLAASK